MANLADLYRRGVSKTSAGEKESFVKQKGSQRGCRGGRIKEKKRFKPRNRLFGVGVFGVGWGVGGGGGGVLGGVGVVGTEMPHGDQDGAPGTRKDVDRGG